MARHKLASAWEAMRALVINVHNLGADALFVAGTGLVAGATFGHTKAAYFTAAVAAAVMIFEAGACYGVRETYNDLRH